MYLYNLLMNKSVIIGLFLMASLLMGTSLNMNMFSTAMASEKDRDDKRYHYDKDDKYRQSTYESDPYSSSYNMRDSYDGKTMTATAMTATAMTATAMTATAMTWLHTINKVMMIVMIKDHTVTIVTTKQMINNMSVKQVHLKDSLPARRVLF